MALIRGASRRAQDVLSCSKGVAGKGADLIRSLDPRGNDAEPSRRHAQFRNNADLTLPQGCGLLDGDVHLEPMLLAQNKLLLNGERLNPCRWHA